MWCIFSCVCVRLNSIASVILVITYMSVLITCMGWIENLIRLKWSININKLMMSHTFELGIKRNERSSHFFFISTILILIESYVILIFLGIRWLYDILEIRWRETKLIERQKQSSTPLSAMLWLWLCRQV